MPFRGTSKEELMTFWKDVERRVGLEVPYQERVDHVNRKGDLLEVATTGGSYRARAVLLPTPFLSKLGIELETKFGTA